jgi:hypothetical protein
MLGRTTKNHQQTAARVVKVDYAGFATFAKANVIKISQQCWRLLESHLEICKR